MMPEICIMPQLGKSSKSSFLVFYLLSKLKFDHQGLMMLLERDDLVENLVGCVIGSVFLSLLCFLAAGIDFSPQIAMILENLSVLEQGHQSIWGKFGMQRRWFQLLGMLKQNAGLKRPFQLCLLCLPVGQTALDDDDLLDCYDDGSGTEEIH
ncbi:hypothetical protein NE237_025909 [Protea cynaroides]|uniref:Uncharacterized protein n=1 Tax=Protea cynaroides TaxID=273540 RepID=A0A9Q0H385_9MAGN|nr:hypothetical protein NE237_025909 [Protea cynaroides]